MKQEIIDEVLYAAYSVSPLPLPVLSGRRIEDEIQNRPYLYPCLFTATPISRRRAISQIMNHHFPVWGNLTKKTTHVTAWTIPFEYPTIFQEIADVTC